jgi:hypothetical protein
MQEQNNIQNQEVLNNILLWTQNTNSQKDETSISVARVISMRYKVYFFIIFFIIWYLLYSFALPSYDTYLSTKDKLNNMQFEISNFESKKIKFNSDISLIDKITKQEDQFIGCVNSNVWCDTLDPTLISNSWFVKDFLQLWNLYNDKMIVDEKIILTNIAEYLTIQTNNTDRIKNWDIKKINIWDPEVFTKNTYEVPMELTITFKNKDWLMSFINNIEKNIMSDKNYRILYKIDEISYNIVDYTKEQDVNIKLSAYYYQI